MPKVTRSGMGRALARDHQKGFAAFLYPVDNLDRLPALSSMEIWRAG